MGFADWYVKHALRKTVVKKDFLFKMIEAVDADGDGDISLGEVGNVLRYLWKKAHGKIREPKTKADKIKRIGE